MGNSLQDIDLFTLWAEETLIEDNLILDILFLIYYESFCVCNGAEWKKLCLLYKVCCHPNANLGFHFLFLAYSLLKDTVFQGIISGSFNFGKLAISSEATHSFYHAKVQLLLILIETLDMENLLQLIHDEMPFRFSASCYFLFLLSVFVFVVKWIGYIQMPKFLFAHLRNAGLLVLILSLSQSIFLVPFCSFFNPSNDCLFPQNNQRKERGNQKKKGISLKHYHQTH